MLEIFGLLVLAVLVVVAIRSIDKFIQSRHLNELPISSPSLNISGSDIPMIIHRPNKLDEMWFKKNRPDLFKGGKK